MSHRIKHPFFRTGQGIAQKLQLQQDKADFGLRHSGTLPVVKVILQVTIPLAKFKVCQEAFVVHDVQAVEYIKVALRKNTKEIKKKIDMYLLGKNQRILHQLSKRYTCSNIVVGVCSLQSLVVSITDNR